jgi:hypothetical protein
MKLTNKQIEEIKSMWNENKVAWDKMVADSGLSEAVFIVTSSDASHFIYGYMMAKEMVIENNIEFDDYLSHVEMKVAE